MSQYEKAYQQYQQMAAKATEGDTQCRKDKRKVFEDCRAMEREAAREGVILRGGKQVGTMPTKRCMQEEYCRKFDGETKVRIGEEVTTLRAYHEKRLLGRK